jgi:DNA-binding transcriptional ArsR family regulator
MKTEKKLERYFKGAANSWRLKILFLLKREPNLNLSEITKELNGNFKTLSEHTHRLLKAGLINKSYEGSSVIHSLSPYGERFVSFAKTFI